MSLNFEIVNSDVYIVRPYSELDIRLKINSEKGEQINIYYRLIDCRHFKENGSNEVVSNGNLTILVSSMPSLSLRAPEKSGDYRLWLALSPEFSEARAVRVIVSVTKTEVSPDISLLKDESELVSGIFFLYERVSVKKLLYNKLNEYKLFFCQAQRSAEYNSDFSYHVIKIGYKHFLKLEIIGLNKIASQNTENFSEIADFIFKNNSGVILFKFNGAILKNEFINLIEFIESKGKIEIVSTIKKFLVDNLASNFYENLSENRDTLINDYESLFFGGKVFGLFSFSPHVIIKGGDLSKPLKIEGENRSGITENYKFSGTIEKACDRSIIVRVNSMGSALERSYFIYNPVIKKERLARFINSIEYDFEIKSAPPLSTEEFYNTLLNKTFSESKDISNLIKKNEIINYLKVLKNDKYVFKTAFSTGGLNPREMYISNNNQILLTSFDNVKQERHILFDFALFETYLKINGAYPLMIKNNLTAKAADEFEDILDGMEEIRRPCFTPYLHAIETVRECASKYYYKPGEAGEYYTALFITEVGLLKNFYINAQSKIAQFIFRSADKRARAILNGSIRTAKLYNGTYGASIPPAIDQKSADKNTAKTAEPVENLKTILRNTGRNLATLKNYSLFLVCFSPPYEGKEFLIEHGSTTLGRSRQSDICLRESPFISGSHALIELSDISVKIKDLQSTNGTFVNGDKINEKVIHEECEIKLGDLYFRLEFREYNKKR